MKVKATNTVDLMFRAVSDRTRLRILHLLRGGELCVCDIVSALQVPQPKASRHLGLLRQAGLVTARKEGLWIHYKLTPASSKFHQKLLDCLACCIQEVPELAKDEKLLKRSKCC
jgi:ArsR family transcriptional regulator